MRILLRIIAVPLLSILCTAQSAKDLLAKGKVDDAIRELDARISSNKGDAESLNLLCRAYYLVEDWDHAVDNCERAVEADGNKSAYHQWLGRAYGEKADHSSFITAARLAKKVRTEFEQAVQLDGANLGARVDLAEFYLEAPGMMGGGEDKARTQALLIGKINPAKEHWVYARIAEKNKDYATAEKEYRSAIDLSKGASDTWLDLAVFYRKRERYDDMESALRKATAGAVNPPEVLMDGADTLLRANRNPSLAIELLKRYLAGPTVEEAPVFKAHYLLGTALEKQGDKQSAEEEYRQSLTLAHNYSRAKEALKRVAG
jgi:tetratricopeptide (TPR) repeat protein